MITYHFSKHFCKNCQRILFQNEKNFFQSSSYFGIFDKKRIFSSKENYSSINQKHFKEASKYNFNRFIHGEVADDKKKDKIFTIPNLLSSFRVISSPYIGYLILTSDHSCALMLFAVASLTDLFDGIIARKWPSQQSALGSVLDPLGDKLLVATTCISLTYVGIIPIYLTSLFVARDLVLILIGLYLRYKTCPPPLTLKRYFDPNLVNVEVTASTISKINTALQMLLLWLSMCAPVFGFVDHDLLKCLWIVTASTTSISAISYAVRQDAFRIITPKKK